MKKVILILLVSSAIGMYDEVEMQRQPQRKYLKCIKEYNKKAAQVYKKMSQECFDGAYEFKPQFSGEEVCASCYLLEDKKQRRRCKSCLFNEKVIRNGNEPWCSKYYSCTGSSKALDNLEKKSYPSSFKSFSSSFGSSSSVGSSKTE